MHQSHIRSLLTSPSPPSAPSLPTLSLAVLQRRLIVGTPAEGVPRGHDYVRHNSMHVSRHALAPQSTHESQRGPKLATLLVLVLVLVLASRHRRQSKMGQGLASCYPALQVRRRHGVAIGGDDEAAGLDEERGLLGVLLGGRILFEEGDGGVVERMMLSKVRQGRLFVASSEGRVATSLEEEVENGGGLCLVLVFGGAMKC